MKKLPVLLFFFGLPALAFAQAPACPPDTPPADDCASSCVFCDLDGYTGSTASYSGDFAQGFCGTIENNQWLPFVAAAQEGIITATPYNCANGDGIQLALYSGCSGVLLNCNGGATGYGATPVSIQPTGLTPGTVFFLMVDGYAGDQCDFTLNFSPPLLAGPQPAPPPPPVPDGPDVVCAGNIFIFSIPAQPNASYYTWTASPGTLLNGLPGQITMPAPGGNQVYVEFGPNGGNVCVTPANTCSGTADSMATACRTVTALPVPLTEFPADTVCYGNVPYELPWGELALQSGTYQTTLLSSTGCDSLVRQTVVVLPQLVTDLGLIGACSPGNCVTICDTTICEAGTYSLVCTSSAGCDSIVHFTLGTASPLQIQAPLGQTITCLLPEVQLNALGSNLVNAAWTDNQGQVVSNMTSLSVSDPGYYTFSAVQSVGGADCPYSKTLLVKENTQAPEGTATGGVLNALNNSVQLTANAITYPVIYSWIGPSGFSSTVQNPIVSAPGTYTVMLTNPATGCSTSISVQVIQQ